MTYNKNYSVTELGIVLCIIMFLVLIIYLITCGFLLPSKGTETLFIKKKEMILSNSEDSLHREKIVFTNDEVYNVEDCACLFKYKSLTVYNNIEEGKTCDVKTIGYRLGFFDMKKNIYEVIKCYEEEKNDGK